MNVDRTNMKPIRMTYTNYRGETALRTVTPIQVDFGSTDWHPEPQWLMRVYDHDKGAFRDFALADCDFSSAMAPPDTAKPGE